MPPFEAGSRQQREAFKAVRQSQREVSFRQSALGGLNLTADADYAAALEEVNRQLDNAVNNIVPRVSRRMAEDLRGGRSSWPVKTGYSRSAFAGTKRGIENVASYAREVEERGMPAERYVRENIAKVVAALAKGNKLLRRNR